jgi:hypothetical protein
MNRRPQTLRRGALLLELVISGLLLGVVISATVPMLGSIARQRQLSRQRQAAILEVGNLMERLTLLDWETLTQERAAAFELAEPLKSALPDSQLKITVAADEAEVGAKHVLIELRWETVPGRPAPPVRLAAWVHRRGGGPADE